MPAPLGQTGPVSPTDRAPEEPPPPLPGLGGSALDSVMPIILFLGIRRLVNLSWAIVAATLWALKVAYVRKRRGHPIGKFLPIVTVAIIARGTIGIITDSEAVYFGVGIGIKASVGLGLIVSALVGRNVIAHYAPMLFGFDRATRTHPVYHRAMDRVAWVAGLSSLVSAGFDVWLFNNSSVGGYLTIRFFVNWPFTTLVLFGCLAYLGRELSRIPGFPGIAELLEARLHEYEDALKHRRAPRPTDS